QEFWPFHPLSIKPDAGTAFEFTTRANTYLFFVDETPGLRFAHTVRYVFVDERGDITTREEESLPSVNGLHWEFDQEIIVDGRVLTVLRDAREAPAPVEPVARTGPDDPAVKRLALLIDGGEARPAWIDSQSARHNAITKKFGEDADAFGAMLAREGFETRRGASRIDLAAEIHRIATETLPGSDVVLYFSADGGAEGMTLYGSGTLIGYREGVLRGDAARWNQVADQLRRELAGKGLAEIDAVARSVDPCLRTTPVTAGSSVVSVTSQALYGPGIVTYPTGSGWRLYTFT